MNILVTNDDGVTSPGLIALVKELEKLGKVTAIAPDKERSAIGHAVTFFQPLRLHPLEKTRKHAIYSCTGTPTDCVLLGLCEVLRKKPDLLVTGINIGPNVGDDVTYSGTVSSAMEGALRGIPSMAVSIATFEEPLFHTAAVVAGRLAPLAVKNGFAPRTLLNVNVPNLELCDVQGIAVTHQGKSVYDQSFSHRKDPRGRSYYWFTYNVPGGAVEEGSDFEALAQKKVSITPLTLNLTCHKSMKKIKSWKLDHILSCE